MKALSIRQPWAWLIVNGYKDVENRNWPTTFRGRFYIHAGKTMTKSDYEACVIFCSGLFLPDTFRFPDFDELERGGIVGEAELVGCFSGFEEANSQWFVGDYGFRLKNAKSLPFVPCKGALGFFEPNL